jgi:predicted TIM-barrel fold metal-dependent hydrolase
MAEPSQRRPIMDIHTHVHPAAAAAMRRVMDAAGVAAVVNLGILEVLDIPFEAGLQKYRDAVGNRMVYFPSPDWRDMRPGFGERMADALERKVALGAGGLKIFKELGLGRRDLEDRRIAVDDPRLDPLWARAGALGVPVLIHTADPLAFFSDFGPENERWEELQAHPDWHFGKPGFPGFWELLAELERVIARHPGTTFIGAHLGNCAEDLAYLDDILARYPNLVIETSARLAEFGRHGAGPVRAFFLRHQDRILFGTDLVLGWDAFNAPEQVDVPGLVRFYDLHRRYFAAHEQQIDHPFPIQGRWQIDAIALPEEVLDKLYVSNARRLIPGLEMP